jgi:DNA adenine methylase
VNRAGHFNVPRGTKDEVLLESDNPKQLAEALQSAHIMCSDFELAIELSGRGDVIYADPPYTVKHNFNGFVKYNEAIFNWVDQERLAESLRRAHSRGVFVVVSNADHPSIRKLYAGGDFRIETMRRNSVISGSPTSRGATTELLIISKESVLGGRKAWGRR